MRFLVVLLCALCFTTLSIAQKKYLVSPNQEVIPVPPGGSAKNLIAKHGRVRSGAGIGTGCSGELLFGFPPTPFPPSGTRFAFSHKDVMGEWFVAPARGTVDSIFFWPEGAISPELVDSQVFVRIFKSNISPGNG